MNKGVSSPGCSRFGQTAAFVPFQPNTNPDGTANPARRARTTRSSTARRLSDPGGLPAGTLEYITFSRFYNVARRRLPGDCARASPAARRSRAGTVALTVPSGWTVEPAKPIGPIAAADESIGDVHGHPARLGGRQLELQDLRRSSRRANKTGYTDNVVRIVAPVEGRFQRWGKWEEYDSWLDDVAPQALAARPLRGRPVDRASARR